MMKLLICDDDISTVDVIQNQLNCQELGITKILRAYNGEAAKEVILREKPELILCDIGMPICNGIDVLKFTREHDIASEFSFLTCYESFEFARDAVRYGATNYLSKPLDFDELKEALNRMISATKAKDRVKSFTEDQGILDNRVNNLLRQIGHGFFGTDQARIDAVLHRNRMSFTANSRWRIVCSTADTTAARENGWSRELLVFSFGRLVEEVLADYVGTAHTIVNFGDCYISTTCFVPEERCTEAELVQRCHRLAQLCTANISVTPVSIISDRIPLYMASEEMSAISFRLRKLRFHSGAVYLMRQTENMEKTVTSLLDDHQVMVYLKTRNATKFCELVDAALDKITHSRCDSDAMMTMLHRDLNQIFGNCLRDNNLSIRSLFEDDRLRQLDAHADRSPADMMLFATTMYKKTVQALQDLNDSTDVIAVVKNYIQEHFYEDIDRDTIAATVYITPNYLSKRFRAEMGMNLREYINHLRVDEAKRLLLTTNETVSEIASKVGYSNISYFSTVFRNQCGMSPIDWRSKATNGGPKQ